MATKLKLLQRGLQSALLHKTLVFGFALFVLHQSNAGFFAIIFFILASLWAGVFPLREALHVPFLVLVFYVAVFLTTRALTSMSLFGPFLAIAVCSHFFLLYYRSRELKEKARLHLLILVFVVYALSLSLFSSDTAPVVLRLLAVFVGLGLLLKEYAAEHFMAMLKSSEKRSLFAGTIALVATEITLPIWLLPLGFFQAANFFSANLFFLMLIVSDFLGGTLSRRILLGYVTVYIAVNLLIFGTVKWATGLL